MSELEKYYKDKWRCYDGEPELFGLTPDGFNGISDFKIATLDLSQIYWASDFSHACGEPIKAYNRNRTSYGLKHIAEHRSARYPDGECRYISNGALILAIINAGFSFKRDGTSPNVFFNVSEGAIRRIIRCLYR